MSKTGRYNYRRPAKGRNQPGQDRHVTVLGVRKDPPDIQKLSRAVIAMELEEAERRNAQSENNSDEAGTTAASDEHSVSPAPSAHPTQRSETDHDDK
jgi:hypothetical protein